MSYLNENLRQIQQELAEFKDIPREELYSQCIDDKLTETVLKYNADLDLNSKYLLTRASMKVLKGITKVQKAADKQILLENQVEGQTNND